MIVGSLLLILVAVVSLVLGLMDGSSLLLTGSITASLLAAVALVVGARQNSGAAAAPLDDAREDTAVGGGSADSDRTAEYALAGVAAGRPGQGTLYGATTTTGDSGTGASPVRSAGPSGYGAVPPPPGNMYAGQRAPGRDEPATGDSRPAGFLDRDDPMGTGTAARVVDDFEDEDPLDEPAPQVVSPADAARVARLTTDVLVIDGRPRYHLPGCVHLLARESEPLPVGEAVELGFTPCSLCEPDNALLTETRPR